MRYNLTSMEIFVAVAKERNLTTAAGHVHLAPSAVSKRVTELEEQVGSALFVRSARGMSLTPAGQSMLHYARQMLKTMQDMDDELSDFARGVKGHVRIHAITSALGQFLPDDLQKFMQQYPLIKFDIEERVGAAIVRAVAEGHADLGIFARETPANGLQLFPYRADRLVLAVPAGHALAGQAQVAWKNVLDYEFVGPHLDSSLHKLITAKALEAGQPVRQRIRVSSFDCLCRMVASGLGIGILPLGILMPLLPSMALTCVRLTDPWAERLLQIGVRDFDSLPATARALVEQLRMPAGESVRSGA